MDENKEEFSFVPSAVSDSAGWHEPRFMCDRKCTTEDFKFHDISAIVVEDDERAISVCLTCQNLRQEEGRNKRWAAGNGRSSSLRELPRQTVGP